MRKENFDFVLNKYTKKFVSGLTFNNNREFAFYGDNPMVWSYDEPSGRFAIAQRTVDCFNDMNRGGGISVFYNDLDNLDGLTVITGIDDKNLFTEMKLTDEEICLLTAQGPKKETFFHRHPNEVVNGKPGSEVIVEYDEAIAKGLPYLKWNIPLAYGVNPKPAYTDYKGDEIK